MNTLWELQHLGREGSTGGAPARQPEMDKLHPGPAVSGTTPCLTPSQVTAEQRCLEGGQSGRVMNAAGLKANTAVSGSPALGSSLEKGKPASSPSAGHGKCWHSRSTHTGQHAAPHSSIPSLPLRNGRSWTGVCPASRACGSALRDVIQLLPLAQLCLQAPSCPNPCSHWYSVLGQAPCDSSWPWTAPPAPSAVLHQGSSFFPFGFPKNNRVINCQQSCLSTAIGLRF